MQKKLLLGIFVLIVVGFQTSNNEQLFAESQRKSDPTTYISTLVGLKLDNVRLIISLSVDDGQYKEKLYQKAYRLFSASGLRLNKDEDITANLKLTLKATPIKGLPQKSLYTQKLSLIEKVNLNRSRELETDAITWSYGLSNSVIIDEVSSQKLESDLEHLIEQFIKSYKFANSFEEGL